MPRQFQFQEPPDGAQARIRLAPLSASRATDWPIALVAKDANPGVRVVARVFDHDLAGRVERRLKLGATRSVSMLAAPAFAAAALGRRSEVIFPINRRVLLFTELTAQPGSSAVGQSVARLAERGASRVLAWAPSGGSWNWRSTDHQLRSGDRVAVAATRSGLARLLRATKGRTPNPPVSRLVEGLPGQPGS